MTESHPEMSSCIDVQVTRSGFNLDFTLHWDERVLVLFGPSGAGKSTLMECILGLAPDASSRIKLAGQWLDDSRKGVHRPAHARELGWVPQAPSLFPHLDVAENLAFGQPRAGRASDRFLEQAVEVLEIGHLMKRSVSALSGGEKSRVALARAMASGPRALLLDEPLAALDVGLRARVLPYLLRVRDEMDWPILYITHDPDEAMLIGERVAVMDSGQLVAQGSPREVLWSRPVLALPHLSGTDNVIEGRIVPGAGESTPQVETSSGLRLDLPWDLDIGTEVKLALPADDILIATGDTGNLSARNILPGRVARCEAGEKSTLVYLEAMDTLVARVTNEAVRKLDLAPGRPVQVIIKAHSIRRLA
ncbi:MAG: molybdenum ABC transporter ATP-binding protein [Myxococcota bacterium]|nr:molybdenum ABC transporter ATP-binding protein [Myxococcota bacterium]